MTLVLGKNVLVGREHFGLPRIELQRHWLQHAAKVLVKVQCQVLNR